MKVRRRTALRRIVSLAAVMVVATLAVMGVTSTVALAADEAESMSHYEATTAEGIKVMVDAPEGALPEDATLNASLISDEGEKDSVASELDDAAVAYDGFMALDVSFTNAAGEEIEPSAAVNVRFEVPQGMLPEGAADLSVHHLAENEDGTVADVEAVADAAEKTDGTVTLADDNTLDAEFQVESFSSFVISWSENWTSYFQVTVNYVDADGQPIERTQSKGVSIGNYDTVIFSDYAGNIDGYTFSGIHYGSVNGDEVASMTASSSQGGFGYYGKYILTFNNAEGEMVDTKTYTDYWIADDTTQTASIYLVYNEVVEPGITITDTVVKDGLFTATPTGGLELPTEGVTYQWERSLDGSTEWENVDRELVTGSHYNLENDGKSVNVAYDSIPAGAANNQRYWYRVTATVTNADGKTTYTSDALQVPYYIELQNGSFETPLNISLTNQIVNGSQGVIWKTTGEGTGSHQGHDIEIVRPSADYHGSMSNYYINHTADGAQFAELNCEAYGALYQDVLTVPGAELNWYLSHAGREGVDKMALVIAPVDVAEEIAAELEDASRLSENQAPREIQRILDEYASKGFVKYFESDKGDWSNYEGTYTVPDGQYVTRFFFVAVDTASNDSSVGNLIDYVGFGSHPRPPEQDEGLLTIRKVVKGFQPDAAGTADYSVTVYVQGDGIDQDVVLTNFTNENGDWVAQGSVTVENMDPGTSQDVTVSEVVSNAPENYTETSVATSTDGDVQQGEDGKSLSNVTIKAGDETGTTITFTNTYEEKASYGIYLYKGAALEQGDKVIADPSHPLQNAKFTVTDSEGELVAEGATGPDGHVALGGNLPAGTYTIRETSVPAGYQLLGYDITLVINSDGSATFQMGNGGPQPAETVTEEGEYQGYFKLSLANYEADMTIPSTGGNGNAPLYVLGAAAVAGSVVMARKRFSSR